MPSRAWMKLAPKLPSCCGRCRSQRTHRRSAKGDIFVVRPGENIPVDGIVLEGLQRCERKRSDRREHPVDKAEGDKVPPPPPTSPASCSARPPAWARHHAGPDHQDGQRCRHHQSYRQVTIYAKNMTVSPHVTRRIEKKTERMGRYLLPDTEMQVRLSKGTQARYSHRRNHRPHGQWRYPPLGGL